MDEFLKVLTTTASSALRLIAADSPIAVAISIGFGFFEKIIISYFATTYRIGFFVFLDAYPAWTFIVITLSFILVPMHLGWSAVPQDVAESIASLAKILKMGNFTKAQQRAYWADLVKVYIRKVGDQRSDSGSRARQSVEAMKERMLEDIRNTSVPK